MLLAGNNSYRFFFYVSRQIEIIKLSLNVVVPTFEIHKKQRNVKI